MGGFGGAFLFNLFFRDFSLLGSPHIELKIKTFQVLSLIEKIFVHLITKAKNASKICEI